MRHIAAYIPPQRAPRTHDKYVYIKQCSFVYSVKHFSRSEKKTHSTHQERVNGIPKCSIAASKKSLIANRVKWHNNNTNEANTECMWIVHFKFKYTSRAVVVVGSFCVRGTSTWRHVKRIIQMHERHAAMICEPNHSHRHWPKSEPAYYDHYGVRLNEPNEIITRKLNYIINFRLTAIVQIAQCSSILTTTKS